MTASYRDENKVRDRAMQVPGEVCCRERTRNSAGKRG